MSGDDPGLQPAMPRRTPERHRPTVEVSGLPLSEGFPVRKIHLEIIDGPERGRVSSSDKAQLRIGADPLCDFVLTDPTVSRNHAEIRQRGQHYTLVDLNSTNGTFHADLRVDSVVLLPGATFRVGRTTIRFQVHTEKISIRPTHRTQYDNIIGQSPALREIFSILDRVAPSELSVVIEGETGSGKEVIARALHDHSARAKGPFVVFDCSAFPASLLESELFGHEKGSFTGAVSRHIGVFERADGGTLFFDELGELDMEFQAKFLRVLELGQLRRVGGEKTIQVDVRVVAATNRNLEQMVEARRFRADLFYRLAQVRFLLPPLRERREDIALLVEHFLNQQAERTGRRPLMEAGAIQVLQAYDWPGNIRQLRNVVEKAVAMCRDGILTEEYFRSELAGRRPAAPATAAASVEPARSPERRTSDIPLPVPSPAPTAAPVAPLPSSLPGLATVQASLFDDAGVLRSFKDVKDEIVDIFERQYLVLLLEQCKGNISRAARTADIDRRHFYRLLKKHGLSGDEA
jgi:DNA-binding NtrC family response regulator